MSLAIGIDLGTTNSVIAYMNGHPRVLPCGPEGPLTPSVVGVRKSTNEILVGREAVAYSATDPVNTVFSIKRLMGLDHGDARVKDIMQRHRFQIAPAPEPDAQDQGIRVLLGEQASTPTEISTRIIDRECQFAERALGDRPSQAVITVPAYFEDRQRDATKCAAEKAGLEVLSIIDEPSAAALAFGLEHQAEKHRVLVYDLGGGTFDISLIQMVGGRYEVLDIQGDNWLGGDDFDTQIVKRIATWVKENFATTAIEDPLFVARAKPIAQKAKHELSRNGSTKITNTLWLHDKPIDIDMKIEREEFEDDIQPLINKTIQLIHASLACGEVRVDQVSQVLLVGGSTKIPLVRQAVKEVFPGRVRADIDPMECVALGAAVKASLVLRKATRTIRSVAPRHLGIAALEQDNREVFVPIIEKGTKYPLDEPKRRKFRPATDNQRLIRVPVYEGISTAARLNQQQGVIEFELPAGIPDSSEVEVEFNYDQNRILTVTIRVLDSGLTKSETLKRGRPRVKDPGTLVDWREDLQLAIHLGKHFHDAYSSFMHPDDLLELGHALVKGEEALKRDEEKEGRRAMYALQSTIHGAGAASILLFARFAIREAPQQLSRALAQAVSALEQALMSQNERQIEQLMDMLTIELGKLNIAPEIANVPDLTSLRVWP